MNTLVDVENVDKIYPVGGEDFYALSTINLSIEKGAFLSFVGPSGSGKTTLLNLIGGLDRPSHGEIRVKGQALSKLSRAELSGLRKNHIGFIFQSYNLLPVYSVYENILFPLILNDQKESVVRDLVMDWVKKVGLEKHANKKPAEISGGQCQRVAIARALVKEPALVLADEPTANLDSENSYRILELMKELNRTTEAAFIFSTHDEKVTQFVNREIRLEDGRILWDRDKISSRA